MYQPIKLVQLTGLLILNDLGDLGVINHVYVDNLIEGIILLSCKGTSGEAYNITDGQKTSWQDYFKKLFRETVGHQRVYRVPKIIAILVIFFMVFLLRILHFFGKNVGKNMDLTLESIKFLSRPYCVSIQKVKQLGYEPRVNLDQGMKRVKKWVQEIGIAK